jgi:hypothetical protein
MKNLASLKLQNITLESYHDINKVFESLHILSSLSIDQSTQLVKPILNNTHLVSQLTRLRHLSLRYTGLVSLTQENIPESTSLDISYNPLRCDCHLAWIQYKERENVGKFLLSKKQTTCKTPNSAEGHTLLESVNITCPNWQTDGILEQTFTEAPMKDTFTNTSTASNSTDNDKSGDNTTVYIALGTILLILIILGIALAVTLSVMKRRRKCQITPDGGETSMEQQQQQQMKKASSKDMLIKK